MAWRQFICSLVGAGTVLPCLAQGFEPRLSVSMFGDVHAVLRDTERPHQSSVQLGQLVLHGIGQLDDHWGALTEAALEFDDATHETKVDLERFLITYTLDDHWSFGIGKRHSPLGHWNNAYHHGAIFQPTIARPGLVAFEDDGGLQPAHDTGVWVAARDLGPTQVAFEALVSNGQTGNQEGDSNANKALTAHAETRILEGVVLGFSGRRDLLSANTHLNGREGLVPLDTTLAFAGADFRIQRAPFLLLSEFMAIRESDAAGEARSRAWFAYAGWTAGNWTPYLLYQRQHIDPATRIYAGGFARSLAAGTLGLKYDFQASINAKLEVSHGVPDTGPSQDRIQVALAFGF